jgi:uncharacterized protein YecE (DUF72 family)
MRKGLFIGTSGWSYTDKTGWLDVFYKSKSGLLKQYLAHFDTAEINSTFYALPQPRFIQHLATGTGDKKFFTAKLPKKVTHDHRLDLSGEGGAVLTEFYSLIKPMKIKLASLLIQLPPWKMSTMADLETFFSGLEKSYRYAIEFRDESWINAKVWSVLEQYNIAHVIVDEPKLPIIPRVTTDFSYIRWHGHGKRPWYNYHYSEEELESWVPHLNNLQEQTKTVVGYFNNHFSGSAPINALQMLKLMGMIKPHQEAKLERMLDYISVQQTSLDDF